MILSVSTSLLEKKGKRYSIEESDEQDVSRLDSNLLSSGPRVRRAGSVSPDTSTLSWMEPKYLSHEFYVRLACGGRRQGGRSRRLGRRRPGRTLGPDLSQWGEHSG